MLPPIYTILSGNSAVAAIVATRIFPHGEAPQDVGKPYITWFMVTGVPENSLNCVPDIDRCTIQIDCWHQTSAGIVSLTAAARTALEVYGHVTGVIINQREPETKLYRMAIQFDYFLNR